MARELGGMALGQAKGPALAELIVHLLNLQLAPALALEASPDHLPLPLSKHF